MSNEEKAEISVVPECFRQFEKFPGAIFRDGKILFTHYSNLFLFIQGIVGVLLFFAFLYILLKSGLVKSGFMFGLYTSLYMIISIIISLQVNIYTVIDYTNNELYKEFCIFQNTIFTFGYVEIKDILQVSNNVIPQIINPEGKNNRVKPNRKSNLFHKYAVSFLVNNGDIIDFIELGGYEEYFEISKNLAKAISQHWGIPLIICSDSQRLYVTGEEERYHFAQEGIPYSYTRSVFISLCILVIIIVFIGSCLK